jgi:hypothetical protein
MLIMTIGPLPDACRTPAGRLPHACWTPAARLLNALKPGIHCVRTHWIRGFTAFRPPGAPGP